jgi:hypothetical protein
MTIAWVRKMLLYACSKNVIKMDIIISGTGRGRAEAGVGCCLVMGGKIDSWNSIGTKNGIVSAMSRKMFIFKAGIDFVLGFSLSPSRESISQRNRFSQRIDSVEPMPGVLKS